ncbi:MAG: glycosyltransferase family 4 protein [Chloroflexi bacterium]|nr:glycosyltransferase family 4 protein [Chloroflexota bacterium]
MRILQLAPIWETVPPPAYGGIELVVSLLTEELVRRGHQVTLFASGDSVTGADLRSGYGRSLRAIRDDVPEPDHLVWLHAAAALVEAKDGYDVIHNHAGELPLLFSSLVRTPMLTTFHGPPSPYLPQIWPYYHGFYNSISDAQQRGYPAEGYLGTIYHGIDVDTFPFDPEKEEYLLFLSRVSLEKGPLQAIEVARRLGKRLIIAGKVDWRDRDFFLREVEPLLDGTQVCFVGEADGRQKRELYRKARCLLLPLQWDEPFGLVMIEAMACGTPVLAFRRGSVPELVVHGKTGFVVDTLEELVAAAQRLDEIDPETCRLHVAQHFCPAAMADRYLAAYDQVLRYRTREAMSAAHGETVPAA